MEKNIYVWGTGLQAKRLMEQDCFSDGVNIIAFVDNYKKEDEFYNRPIISPDEIGDEYDYIVISNEYPGEIIAQCKELRGVDVRKLIVVFNYRNKYLKYIDMDDVAISIDMPYLWKKIDSIRKEGLKADNGIYHCYYDKNDEECLIGKNPYMGEYEREYIRYRAFELAVKELVACQDEEWDVAELGVFRGAFSRLINDKFPNRTLYLFDTFEGFDCDEASAELASGNCDENFVRYFADTNADAVYNSMPKKEKCIIKKGMFPQTSRGLENRRFGFVSLDVDFEESTLNGLRFFYPRLIEGGYIFVHDYNHASLKGVKRAIERYESEIGTLKKFPLPDSNGSLIITK